MRTPILATIVLAGPWLGAAAAQSTWRASVDSSGAQSSSGGGGAAVSALGQFVAFVSSSTDLVAGDTNNSQDVFVNDHFGGSTVRVTVDSSGAEANANSFNPSISADGRFVAFESVATNLVAGDTNSKSDVFVHDLQTGATVRVSVDSSGAQGNADSFLASLSADGRFVAFSSNANNLVAGDANAATDVFIHDLQTGVTELVSVDSAGTQGNKGSNRSAVNADGRFVAFTSFATNLVAGDTNGTNDIFVRDRQGGTTERVSVDSSGVQGNKASMVLTNSALSADGRCVVFDSDATNLVGGDWNGWTDAFLRDRTLGTTERLSVDSNGIQGDRQSYEPSISADGRFVAFWSWATILVPGDTNGVTDVFVRDREAGTTTRASVDSAGNEGGGASSAPSLSADGQFVAFASGADDLVPGDSNGVVDVFVRDRGSFVPYVGSVAPARGAHGGTTAVTVRGANFRAGALIDVLFNGQPSTSLNVVDDTTITCDAPGGLPGPALVTVVTTVGSGDLAAGFTFTPSVRWSGDATPGGSIAIDYLCDPLDGIFAIAGVPPAVAIPTPPYLGSLCIAPFTLLFVLPPQIWPFDVFTLKATIPADPSLSGATVLLQALTGSSFKKPKNAAWTDCAAMTIQ